MRSTANHNSSRQTACTLLQVADAIEEATTARKTQRDQDAMTSFMRQLEDEQKSILGLVRDSLGDLATIASTDSSELPFDERSMSLLSLSSSLDKSFVYSTMAESRDEGQEDTRRAGNEDRQAEVDSTRSGNINAETKLAYQRGSLGPYLFSRIQKASDKDFGNRKISSPVSLTSTSPTLESISEVSEHAQQPLSGTKKAPFSNSQMNQRQLSTVPPEDSEEDILSQLRDSAESIIDEQEIRNTPTAINALNKQSAFSLFARDAREQKSESVAADDHLAGNPHSIPEHVTHQATSLSRKPPKASKKSKKKIQSLANRDIESAPSKDKTSQNVPTLSYSMSTKDSMEESTPTISSYISEASTLVDVSPQVHSPQQENMLKECYAAIISLKQASESKYEMLETKYLELKHNFTHLETHNVEKESKIAKNDSIVEDKYQDLDKKHAELTEIIAQLEAKNQKLLDDSTRTAEQHLELKESYLQLEYQNDKLKEELVNFDDKFDDLQDAHADMKAKNDQLEMESQLSEKLDERCQNVETKCLKLQESFAQLEAQNQSLKEEKAALQLNHELMDSKCRDLVQSNIQLKSRNLKLEDMNESLMAMQTSLEASLKSAREEIKVNKVPSGFASNHMQQNCSEKSSFNLAEHIGQDRSQNSEQRGEKLPSDKARSPLLDGEEGTKQSADSTAYEREMQRQLASSPLNPWGNAQSPRMPPSSPRPPLPPQLRSPSHRNASSPSWNVERHDDLVEIVEDVSSSESDDSSEDSSTATPEDCPELVPSPRKGRREQSPSNILEELLREQDEDEEPASFFMKDVSLADSDETISPEPLSPPQQEESGIGKPASTLEMMTRMCSSREPKGVAETLTLSPEKQALKFGAMLLFGPQSDQAPLMPHLRSHREECDIIVPRRSNSEDDRTQNSGASSEDELKLIMTRSSTLRKSRLQQRQEQQNATHEEHTLVSKKKRDLCDCFMPLEFDPPQPKRDPEGTSPPHDLALTIKKGGYGCDPCDAACGVAALAINACSPRNSTARKTWKNHKRQHRAALMNGEKSVVEVTTVQSVATMATTAAVVTAALEPKVMASFDSAASSDNGSTISAKVHNSKKTLRARARARRQQEQEANEQGLVMQTSSSGSISGTSSGSSSQSEKVALKADKKVPLRPLSGGGRVFPFL